MECGGGGGLVKAVAYPFVAGVRREGVGESGEEPGKDGF